MSAPEDPVDEGWDDGADDGGDDGAAEGSDDGAGTAAADAPASGEAPRKRRRRRRRRRDGGEADPHAQRAGQPTQSPPPQHRQAPPQGRDPQRQPRETQRPPQREAPRPTSPPQRDASRPTSPQQQSQHAPGGGRDRDGRRNERSRRERERRRHRDPRESISAIDPGGVADLRAGDDFLRGDPYGMPPELEQRVRRSHPTIEPRGSQPTIDARGSQPVIEDDEPPSDAPAVAWGTEDDSPAPTIALSPDLPVEPPASDPDPLTFPLVDGPGAQLGDDVASVVGVRFVPAGRIQWCDAGDRDYVPGERVLVDSDRGHRLAWIATPPTRRPVRDRNLRRVIRRANEQDLRGEREGEAERARTLRIAKDAAAALKLPLKVFRVEKSGGRLNVYYTSDERLDLRDFVREVGQATGLRLELRQLGVRDEAKVVGGIGSCGLTLCCSTWLPEFVPVSIKMAKDQGLVLSPTKVSGQCGRLKCCLVYEQAGYAELRKGLPKLGKRVISPRGEGRVVEVDVLRQRVRVSYGPGDTEVLPATEVRPMFPSGNQPREPEPDESDDTGLPDS